MTCDVMAGAACQLTAAQVASKLSGRTSDVCAQVRSELSARRPDACRWSSTAPRRRPRFGVVSDALTSRLCSDLTRHWPPVSRERSAQAALIFLYGVGQWTPAERMKILYRLAFLGVWR